MERTTYYFHVSYNLYAQIHLFDDWELTNGHIYEITGFDLFVIVKFLQSTSNSKTCTCSPVMYPSFIMYALRGQVESV